MNLLSFYILIEFFDFWWDKSQINITYVGDINRKLLKTLLTKWTKLKINIWINVKNYFRTF